jgi:hypothetical protein
MQGIADILFVRFRIEDFSRQRKFLEDFGFQVEEVDGRLIARGTDPSNYVYVAEQGEPEFLGLGFEALSRDDLDRIAAIDGAEVKDLELPGGGVGIRLLDPDGYEVDVVFGIEAPSPVAQPVRQPLNSDAGRPRLGERVSFEADRALVKRLGHCVLNVTDFRVSESWYKERIGFITSDEVYMGTEDKVLGAFLRCDRGEEFVDHHTMFLVGAGHKEFNHAAFEVGDWDTLMLGHYHLGAQGYEHSWGVGKHLLGSQVFDYWKDPSGFTLEHFTDGDLFNDSFGSHKAPVEQLLGSHWGPDGSP